MNDAQTSFSFEPIEQRFSVKEITRRIADLLSVEFSDIWVEGEISDAKLSRQGHYYFCLKGEDAVLNCVCFRGAARFLKFRPEDGLAVAARGRIDVYEARGQYQFLVEALEPLGFGALQLAFEQLKKKLAGEGLFEQSRKRPLPPVPRRIGIVTSPTGAAIRDILNILGRRFPGIEVRVYPSLVQGEGAAEQIAAGIEWFTENPWADVLIVGRGGGSLEDLWSFNTEVVARAIAASKVPVVSAVGHETDFTIADFVADLRAPTPSAAAELVVPNQADLLAAVVSMRGQLGKAAELAFLRKRRRLEQVGTERAYSVLHRRLGNAAQRLDEVEFRLRDAVRGTREAAGRRLERAESQLMRLDLRVKLAKVRASLEEKQQRLGVTVSRKVEIGKSRQGVLEARLRSLSPVAILDRGYALVSKEDGKLVRDAASLNVGESLRLRFATGGAKVAVEETDPGS